MRMREAREVRRLRIAQAVDYLSPLAGPDGDVSDANGDASQRCLYSAETSISILLKSCNGLQCLIYIAKFSTVAYSLW